MKCIQIGHPNIKKLNLADQKWITGKSEPLRPIYSSSNIPCLL